MDKQGVLKKLNKLRNLWSEEKIPKLHKHEVNPKLEIGSRENYLYFIMTCSLNFQRSSPKTWQSALETWNDQETRYVFFPEEVKYRTKDNLRTSLLKHKLALQPNKHIEIWNTLMGTIFEEFNSDPRNLFIRCDYDTEIIIKTITKDMKKKFPYLSGPKLSNYFLYILLQYSDLKLKNRNRLSIIPDTHIMKSTEVLGILPKEQISPLKVESVWQDLLQDTNWSPVDFHPILWNWSRNKFQPEV